MFPVDAGQLAKDLIPYLLPLLPHLKKGIEFVGGEALNAIKEESKGAISEAAKRLWGKLWPKIEADPAAKATVEKAAENPEDQRIQPALELQLESLLADEKFRAEIAALLDDVKKEGVMVSNRLDIDEHAGKAVGIDIESGAELREAGVTRVEQKSDIRKTEKGSEITGIRIGGKKPEKPKDEE